MRVLAAAILATIVAGCSQSGLTLLTSNIPTQSHKAEKQVLTIGNTQIPVEVEQHSKDGLITISIQDEGEEIEQEQYKIDGSELDLLRASDDSFDPPLPLLHFPATAGQTYNWQGTLREGTITHDATAQISVTSEPLKFKNGMQPSLRSDVQLSIASDPAPAKRTFEFWFTTEGLAKRIFGAGTVRSVDGLGQ